jgi:hypothetical protein
MEMRYFKNDKDKKTPAFAGVRISNTYSAAFVSSF